MQRPDNPRVPLLFRVFLDIGDSIRRFRASRWETEYEYFFLDSKSADLDDIRGWVEEGKLRTVVGTRVDFRDIEKVREACMQVYRGKGGIGKAVFEIVGRK